jgi:rod shape-determining protein MreC
MDLNRFRDRVLSLFLILIGSVVLLLLDSVGVVGSLYDFSSLTTVPVRLELHKFSQNVNNILGVVGKVSSLQEENEALRQENKDLLESLSGYEECRSENESLKEQLDLSELSLEWILEARVIGSETAFENTLQINVGTYEGVEVGDIVVFGKFAVGEVKRVEKYTSKVLLITSPLSNIPVRGQTNRAAGLVRGDVGLTLKMIDILPDEKVEEGEIVVTSGVESSYPADLIIGVISRIESDPAYAIQQAYAEVQIDFSKLDYVYVIKGQK